MRTASALIFLVNTLSAVVSACGSSTEDVRSTQPGGTSGTAGTTGGTASDGGSSGQGGTGDTDGSSGSGSTGGTGGVSGSAGTGGQPEPDGQAGAGGTAGTISDAGADARTDIDRIDQCSAPETCPRSLAQHIETSSRDISMDGLGCVFRALRDRTPGKLVHYADHIFPNGATGARHALLITRDGSAKYARAPFSNFEAPPVEAGQKCRLKPASYFEACLQALNEPTGETALACAFGDGSYSELLWFESCTSESPLACD